MFLIMKERKKHFIWYKKKKTKSLSEIPRLLSYPICQKLFINTSYTVILIWWNSRELCEGERNKYFKDWDIYLNIYLLLTFWWIFFLCCSLSRTRNLLMYNIKISISDVIDCYLIKCWFFIISKKSKMENFSHCKLIPEYSIRIFPH
jgi:hypothetical protein